MSGVSTGRRGLPRQLWRRLLGADRPSHVVSSGGSLDNLVLDSGTYNFVPGSGIVVCYGDTSTTDLTLFPISTDPGLANLLLAISAPAISANVVMVGRGSIEGSAITGR